MSCYILGDHHLGMYCWDEETGEDNYDATEAERLLMGAVEHLVSVSAPSETGVLVNLGDFLHANDTSNLTPGAKNLLDTDGRFGMVARRAGYLLKALIDQMLLKHKYVQVINARGNHDPDAAIWLNQVIKAFYHKEKRVKVLENNSKFIWFTFGSSLVVCNHGDKINRARMYEAITRNLRNEWGSARYVYGWTGHIHHKQAEEIGGMQFESWNVLPPPDAWHSEHGYGAQRSMSCVKLHREYGKIGVDTIPVDQIK
jgi:hypothetical protein